MSASTKKSLEAIFKGPSDDEEFNGFGSASSEQFSEESRDSLRSQSSWKPDHRFRSKFITDELAQLFMETDSEEEFEGFSKEDSSAHSTWMNHTALESENDSDDIGFYSDDDNPAPQKKRSSGLCVAFRFPARKSSAHESQVPTKSSNLNKARVLPVRNQPLGRSGKRRGGLADDPVVLKNRKIEKSSDVAGVESVEEDSTETAVQVLSQRAKNIQENKAMLAKLFADLSALPELSPKTTPIKKKKQQTPRQRVSEVQSERRNPSRKARPPEHFGLEQEPVNASQPRKSVEIDLNKLLEVDEDLRGNMHSPKRKYRKRSSVRMPEDIIEEELDNVADRAKDKILDKENYMSPVQTEDSRHQDRVQEPILSGGQRAVLWTLLT
ncbi:cell division cycle-associated 7-like protein isoform X2 [Trichomycterus rosablanca]|uniref:cell division cycle-associated 7-like protein isoform X2 n=1 Tax=Trichomycterus rosablanca TaxID=2290929 RepID=UPI002F35A114